jgi:hypothetical protein
MGCYKPLQGWHSDRINKTGRRSIVFNQKEALHADIELKIACGQCIGCRIEKSRQWATRCVHEASLHEDNAFITLTFSDEEVLKRENPESLDKRDFQKFMKRLRRRYGNGIRYYHCGEYGDEFGRPHYHACLFNHDFKDKELWNIKNGNRIYRSQSLEELWPYGYSTIGEVTFQSAAYVARYIMKKINGDLAEDHYKVPERIDYSTGEVIFKKIEPEYTTMSRRPGIGKEWFDKYKGDLFPKDFVTVDGKKVRIPRYYDKLLEAKNPWEMEEIKEKREEKAEKFEHEQEPERLRAREKVLERKIQKLIREI